MKLLDHGQTVGAQLERLRVLDKLNSAIIHHYASPSVQRSQFTIRPGKGMARYHFKQLLICLFRGQL